MAVQKSGNLRSIKIGNTASLVMVLFLSAAFIIETMISDITANLNYAYLFLFITLIILISFFRTAHNNYKLAFNVPFVILIYYTVLMFLCEWQMNHYLLICLSICAISCIYSHFTKTLTFIVFQNAFIGVMLLFGIAVGGQNTPLLIVIINWVISLFASIIILILTRAATTFLNRALEHQQSFMDLLYSTENYVAMIDERNEIIYASKTLANLGNVADPIMVQGRPILDLFPGRTLKIYAGKLLKEKDGYSADWEFSLNGQKRYFKAASHILAGAGGGTLINMYDMTHLAERDEIAVMKDSMQIGLFFIDKNFVIQDHYSRYLESMFIESNLAGKVFTDLFADSVSAPEMTAIKDYFKMLLERTYDQEMLEEINPLNELHYRHKRTGERKVFQCVFATVERGRNEIFILVTVYDITTRVELQIRLAEEETRRQEETQAVFELIQVQPDVFNDFMGDMEHEFQTIDIVHKDESLSVHDALVKIYQSIHAIKSNAVILGLNVFGNKVHSLESKIKKLREKTGEIPFADLLDLTMEIDKLSNERESFRDIINKIEAYSRGSGDKTQNIKILIDSLTKTANRAAEDEEKLIKLVASDIDIEAIEKGPRRVMKEILMQLIRNSAVHGIEMPEVRKAKGKKETGIIKLIIKISDDKKSIQIKYYDDGNGLDYKKIAERAISKNMIKKEDENNRDALLKIIFMPGFSTAETEGLHAGRGIGLNLVRDRIKEINGTVKLHSEDGKGIIFYISIPISN